jgi:uncharacterized protein (TIGR02145 family)
MVEVKLTDAISVRCVYSPSPSSSFTLTSSGNEDQTICQGSPISDITFVITGATDAAVSGLPAGVTASWDSGSQTLIISGTPAEGGIFEYTVTITDGATTSIVATGTITVSTFTQGNPTSGAISVGNSYTFTLAAASSPAAVTYQWQTSADDINWIDAPGASTGANYTTQVFTHAGIISYFRRVATCSACGISITSNSATVTVYEDPGTWDGVECGAFVAPDVWKKFMCRNLGADQNADPFTPSADLNGDYYQWGSKTPAATRDAIIDTWSNIAPAGWYGDNSTATDAKVKSDNDPCPAGYRVPTYDEWEGVFTYNIKTNIGDMSISDPTNWTGCMYGDNLFLPAAGYRDHISGALNYRGHLGDYWSSRMYDATYAYDMYFYSTGQTVNDNDYRTYGQSIRCIEE